MNFQAPSYQAVNNGSLEVFQQIVEGIASTARLSGLNVTAGTRKSWDFYRSLSNERKEAALKASLVYSEICNDTTREGRPLSDTRMSLWSSLRHYGLIPHSDLMNYITDDMVVELYTAEGNQLYRNMKFLEVCSYTLADVFMHPWYELFERNDEMVSDIDKEVAAILMPGSSTIASTLKPHRIVEAFSEERLEIEMTFKYWSPVFIKGQTKPYGIICTSCASILGTQKPLAEIKPLFGARPLEI